MIFKTKNPEWNEFPIGPHDSYVKQKNKSLKVTNSSKKPFKFINTAHSEP